MKKRISRFINENSMIACNIKFFKCHQISLNSTDMWKPCIKDIENIHHSFIIINH